MVAEPWITKLGNQVSTNLKHALHSENLTKSRSKKQIPQPRQTIGILSFEVANIMSKLIHLHKSITETEISKLRNEISKSEGIKALVSSDETQLLELARVEKLDDLNRVASVVSRLGSKCTLTQLQGFEHVYGDIVSGSIDVKQLGFLVKDMDNMVKKMERYVNSTSSLYGEIEVMNELETATKKFQQNQHEESRKAFEQKLMWQKQDVKHLKDISLWNQTYDKVVEILARTVCTVYARIITVFGGDSHSQVVLSRSLRFVNQEPGMKSGNLDVISKSRKDSSLIKSVSTKSNGHSMRQELQRNNIGLTGLDFSFPCGTRIFMECLSLRSSASKVDDDDDRVSYDDKTSQISGCFSVPSSVKNGNSKGSLVNNTKIKLLTYAPPTTVGGSALALRYANVIIVIEKLLHYPHLIGDEVREDLYHMLPTSLKKSLKNHLKSYVKDLAIYDAPLAHHWRERLDSMLQWLAPLAHNMISWQSERNFEQHQIVKRTNVLLLQTLYFSDREKVEGAICELLVGLNYMCRYEQQQNALLDCASSFDFDECVEWQSRVGN